MLEKIKENDKKILIVSAERGDLGKVKLLLEAGVDVQSQEDYPLFIAASKGHPEIVKVLLDNGADVDVDDNAPLYVAATKGYVETVKVLIEYGADMNVVSNKIKKNWGEDSVSYKYICELEKVIAVQLSFTSADYNKTKYGKKKKSEKDKGMER